ncbi:hypothetical protein [Mesorhizobium prunaredense]|uniref:hypothetical protein n=1 Tax=Mesorhizobium prunaredense TaxID=1631249 RepID=UPI00117E5F5D|nr:hypothetical protein [Mesorhizobium prunaredense]
MSRLSLGRLNLETRISYAQAAQLGPASDPAGTLAKEVAASLSSALGPICDSGGPAVWIIRRLDFDLAGGRSWEPGLVADALAEQLRAVLLRVLSGECSDIAIRFPDRAAYLAQFLADLVDGKTWDRWYYGAFAPLHPLPVGAAVRMVLEKEPGISFDILVRIAERGGLPRFLAGLGVADADRILAIVAEPNKAMPDMPVLVRICESLVGFDPPVALGGPKAMLEAMVRIGIATGLPAPVLMAGLRFVAGRLRTGGRASDRPEGRDRRAVPADLSAAARSTDVPTGGRLQSLLKQLAGRAKPGRKRSHAARAIDVDGIVTPRAGVFLLWRSVIELGLDPVFTAGCPAGLASARRQALAVALSGLNQPGAEDDEALRWLTLHEPDEMAAPALFADNAAAVQQALFATLTGLRPARPLHLVVQRVGDVSILQDALTQDWYHAARGAQSLPLPDAEIASVLVPGEMMEELPAALRRWEATPIANSTHVLFTERPGPRTETLAAAARALENLRPAGPDLDYLAGGRDPDAVDLSLMLFARAAYADVGRRLPGLTLSSAAYLGRNAVHGVGRLRINPSGSHADAEVDLSSVPFDFIWRMTGLGGTVYRLADGRSILLNMAGG